jgi:hypothetical protein
MTSQRVIIDAAFEGPAGMSLDGSMHIDFEHQPADSLTGTPEGIAIWAVRVQIGAAWHEFKGDLQSDDLIAPCWQHLKDEAEAAAGEVADRRRDEARDRVAEMWSE